MKNKTMKFDQCEYCDGEVNDRVVRARFSFKGETIYIDNVPAWVCSNCSEQYFDAPVYKKLEEIAKTRHRIKRTVCFPLANYDTATI